MHLLIKGGVSKEDMTKKTLFFWYKCCEHILNNFFSPFQSKFCSYKEVGESIPSFGNPKHKKKKL
jgi:hypothetical protein